MISFYYSLKKFFYLVYPLYFNVFLRCGKLVLIGILNLSIAHGHLHKLASLVVLAFMVFWEPGSCDAKFIHLLLCLLWDNVVGATLLLDSSEVGELVHGGLGDWDDSVNNVP